MSLRRFEAGITDILARDPLSQLGMLDPTKYAVYMEDFLHLGVANVANTTVTTKGYKITSSANNTTSIVTDAGGRLGCLSCVSTTADNESTMFQALAGGFVMTSGKKFFMETSFETTAASIADTEIVVGLTSSHAVGANFFATNGTARTFDDGLAFVSVDGSATLNLLVGENDVFDSITAMTTMVTATWYKFSVYYDGTDIYLYRDDVLIATHTPNQIPVSVIMPVIWFKTGAAAVQTFLVDYLFVAAER